MALRRLFSCPNLDQSGLGGKGRERETNREREIEKERVFRERDSTFSLSFSTIGPVCGSEARGRVDPHSESFASRPVLGVSKNSRNVGVFLLLALLFV